MKVGLCMLFVQIINESFLPLIGEKKTRYECEMDIFEVSYEI